MTATRRIVVGFDEAGRSCVLVDGSPGVSVTRPNGAVVHEIWREKSLPGEPGTWPGGEVSGSMEPLPPPAGVSVRVFTLPPDQPSAQDAGRLDLARTPSMYVAAVLSGRAYLVLESSEVLLEPGDTFVLPGALHAWRNPFAEDAVMLATVYPLIDLPATT